MPTNEISVAGAGQFANNLTFGDVTLPPKQSPDWTVVIRNLSVLVLGNIATRLTIAIQTPAGGVVMLPVDKAFTAGPSGLSGPTFLGCDIPVPRDENGNLYTVRVTSVGKAGDGVIAYTYELGLVPNNLTMYNAKK